VPPFLTALLLFCNKGRDGDRLEESFSILLLLLKELEKTEPHVRRKGCCAERWLVAAVVVNAWHLLKDDDDDDRRRAKQIMRMLLAAPRDDTTNEVVSGDDADEDEQETRRDLSRRVLLPLLADDAVPEVMMLPKITNTTLR
jgi:hypothetical protein